MRIDVTVEDIRLGRPCQSFCCPVALAIKRATDAKVASVLARDVIVTPGPRTMFQRRKYAPLPREAQKFVLKFDNGQSVKPFSFELNLGEL